MIYILCIYLTIITLKRGISSMKEKQEKGKMHNMFYNIPTKYFCESSCIANHAADIAGYGKKACIVTGKNSTKQNNSLNDMINALDAIGTEYTLYDQIEENPSVELIMDAVSCVRDFEPDFVIGMGGGSPLDASKSIALMLANPGRDRTLLFDIMSDYNAALPVIAVPTTCGTGSEITPYSILTLHDKKTKSSIPHSIFPVLALADPAYLKSASDNLLKYTAVDALGHFIESYINSRATVISRMFCEKGMSMWKQVKNILLKTERTDEDYETLLIVSSFAGMAISHTGTSLPHGMSYSLTYDCKVPHGKAVGTFLASYIANSDAVNRHEVLMLLGYSDVFGLQNDLRTLIGTVEVSREDYESYVNDMSQNKRKLASCPFEADSEKVAAMYRESLIEIKR